MNKEIDLASGQMKCNHNCSLVAQNPLHSISIDSYNNIGRYMVIQIEWSNLNNYFFSKNKELLKIK